jgi:hypothetical protein
MPPDPSNPGYEPWYPVECVCGHMDTQHHWTGRKYLYCTVWRGQESCPCERFTP